MMHNTTTAYPDINLEHVIQFWLVRATKLEAINAELTRALTSIANNTCCKPCREAAKVAAKALARVERCKNPIDKAAETC